MPEVDWTFLANINLWQVALVIVALWVIFRLLTKFWPWLKQVIALTDALAQLPAFIDRTDTRIEQIHHEVHYNNGSSVKDAVRRVETGVAGLYDRMDESDQKLDGHIEVSTGWKNRLDAIDERTQPGRPPRNPKEK